MKLLKALIDLLSSYGLACVLLVLLAILTYLGTLEQVDHGIYDVQKKYFESVYLVHHLFGTVPILLPGAYPLLVLLFFNLLLGGIVRIRKGKMTLGVIIGHSGILLLLLAGFVNFKFANYGHMALYEGQESSQFVSYHDWEVVIARADGGGPVTEYIIPGTEFIDFGEDGEVTFTADELPFDVTLTSYYRNAVPLPAGPMTAPETPVVDGWFFQVRPPETEAEMNMAGMYVTAVGKDGGTVHEGLLWGSPVALPFPVVTGGAVWGIDLRKKQWQLPFTIRLNEFTHEYHPGTRIAKTYMSDVTKVEDGAATDIRIQMNEPLRYRGYTFFQASFGTRGGEPDGELFSVLAVVKNPSDQWPLYACLIIAAGLLVHFCQKLWRYIRAQNRRLA